MSSVRKLQEVYSKDQIQDIFINFSLLLLNKRTEEEVIWSLTKNCISYLGFEDCVVYLLDTGNQLLVQKAAHGPKCNDEDQINTPLNIPVGNGITGHVAKFGKPLLVKDTSQDDRYIIDDKQRLSEICVPIKLNDRVIGVIDCEHSEKNYFNFQHQEVLSAVASICAIKISQLRADKILLEKEKEALRISEQMAQLKLQALQAQLNPHFIFNALNAIQYFLSIENHRAALDYLSLFGKVLRYITNQINKNEVVLDHEIHALTNYLNLQKLRYDDRFEYVIAPKDCIDSKKTSVPSFLLLNLIEEIIESHIGGEQHRMKIQLHFEFKKNHLIFSTQISYHSSSGTSSGYRTNYASWEKLVKQCNEYHDSNIEYAYEKPSKLTKGQVNSCIKVEIPLN
ncbi:histidine kinase [Reichenbachiella sp.]|uniref:histidine kinase n=1 Tax=Reichenbachiella sp. TaxID=2184521 RepID=UPI003BB1FD86